MLQQRYLTSPIPCQRPLNDVRTGDDLLSDRLEHSAGAGPVHELGHRRGKLVILGLEIDEVVEQESLKVSIEGSDDGIHWYGTPLLRFPIKSYCGLYRAPINLAEHPSVGYLRATWEMSKWRRNDIEPMFRFSIALEEPCTVGSKEGSLPICKPIVVSALK